MVDFSGIKKGDRVRIVLEADDVLVSSGTIWTKYNGFTEDQSDIVSVEVIKPPASPLPDTPGSVIVDDSGTVTLVLDEGRRWRPLRFLGSDYTASVEADHRRGQVNILFDAGAK